MCEGSIFLFTFRLFLRHTHKKKQMEETEFEHIAQEMRPRLTAHCQRYLSAGALAEEADDIVQETLMKLWKMRERLSEYQSIEALGMTIARNLCIDHQRRNKAQTASLDCRNLRSQQDEHQDDDFCSKKIIAENDEVINSKNERNEETRRYNLSPRADRTLPRC